MPDRVSKQIKLTESEFDAIQVIASESSFSSLKCFLDDVLTNFIDEQQKIRRKTEFLLATKSGKYRTIWFDSLVVKTIKIFSEMNDASENAVIFTAVKQRLNKHIENYND